MSDEGPARTMFASKAVQLHTYFAARFKDTKVGSKVPRRVVVQEIDVETTGGGQLAKMSITLIPEGQPTERLVAGWIDVASSKVRMRSHRTLANMFKAQKGRFFDLDESEYQTFLDQAKIFVDENNFAFEVYDEDKKYGSHAPAVQAPQLATKSPMPILIAIAIAVIVIVAVIFKFA